MDDETTYNIKYVSLQTGIKPYLIRTWESRYQAVCPQRADNSRRCFTDEDIRRLHLLKQAVDQGHTISSVSRLNNAQLTDLLRRSAVSPAPVAPPDANGQPAKTDDAHTVIQTALVHIRRLDAQALETLLRSAAVQMPRPAFLEDVVMPLFAAIGELWQRGEIKVVGEHMASTVVRALLWEMLKGVDLPASAPVIVVSTPVGHWHEFGALAVALAAAESGWRAAYFGPNLPCEEIAYAVNHLQARAVAISLCHRQVDDRVAAELNRLGRLVGPAIPLFVGGAGLCASMARGLEKHVILVENLDMLRKALEKLAEQSLG